jgi:P-type E1-E2 ATPase
VPEISVSGGIPNILLPLLFVISVSAAKDALEDSKRKQSDKEENERTV